MMRSMVEAAVVVWRVPNTRWPVSAVSIAIETVSRSRISPTRMMSGSSRSAARSACLNDRVWTPDLPLGHQALLALVHELDRILDRDDVVGAGAVDQVHQGGQRRALARAGGAGDHDEPLGEVAEVLDLAAEPHLVGGADRRRDDAEDRHRSVPVAAGVAAEAGEPVDLVGPVGVADLAELGDLARAS